VSYQLSESADGGVVERLGAFASRGASHRTLAEKAFVMVHDAIVSGALQPGERLPIEDLAAATGMSPMPIREALRRLDGVGLVENIPHRGARVADLSIEDLRDVYDSRLMLEVSAIGRAAQNFAAKDGTAAEQWLERLDAAVKRDADTEILEAHTGFHFSLYDAAASRWLLRLISPLWDSAERYRVATIGVSRLFGSRVDEHVQLLDACREHQGQVAEARLWNHLVRTANLVAVEMGGGELYELKAVPEASASDNATR
jgi:DNA-binding GntR family transcriptional regulator